MHAELEQESKDNLAESLDDEEYFADYYDYQEPEMVLGENWQVYEEQRKRPALLVSACLLGEACRYDGRSKPCARVQELAADGHELVPICPEAAGGLPTPRTPCEIVRAPWIGSVEAPAADDGTPSFLASEPHRESNGRSGETEHGRSDSASRDSKARAANEPSWTILDASGADRTAAYARGAQAELARAKEAGCELAILKAKSPSCGSGEVYDGTFSGTLVPGWGIAAAAFRDAGITVIDETADFNRLANG